jgi:DNA-binding MarR family transcriptional regulator
LTTQELSAQQLDSSFPPAVRAWTRLLRAHAAATRILSASLLDEHGLSLNDYEALQALAHAPGRRLRRVDLARRLLLTPSGVTRLLEGLEAAGDVERDACPSDLRVTYARMTDAGQARLDAASCSHVRAIRSLMAEWFSDEEVDLLAELLGRFPGVLEAGDACPAATAPPPG